MKDENGNIIFDADEQVKVDEIVKERLSRVKAEKPADYDDLAEIVKDLEEFGYSGTPAEKKAAIKAYIDEINSHKKPDYQEVINKFDEIPDDKVINALAKKFGVSADKVEKAIKKSIESDEADEKKKSADENWKKQLEEVQADEKLKDIDLDELAEDPKFKKFIKGKALPLKELLEDYIEFVGETEAEAFVKVKSKDSRSTSSGKGASSDGQTYGLTTRQQDLAKKSGMTYKEYAEYQKHIL